MDLVLVLIILALIFGGGFVLRLIGLAVSLVVTIVIGAVVVLLVVAFLPMV